VKGTWPLIVDPGAAVSCRRCRARGQRDPGCGQGLTGPVVVLAIGLAQQPEQKMSRADVVVPKLAAPLLREHDHPPGRIGESFEHGSSAATSRSDSA